MNKEVRGTYDYFKDLHIGNELFPKVVESEWTGRSDIDQATFDRAYARWLARVAKSDK